MNGFVWRESAGDKCERYYYMTGVGNRSVPYTFAVSDTNSYLLSIRMMNY